MKNYYEAYDDRYQQVHEQKLRWASDEPTPIVSQVIRRVGIDKEAPVLELGCGEGRDASALLQMGYSVTATDISPEAIRYCRARWPRYADAFRELDCVGGQWEKKYRFIYAVAVVHMLVEEEHRKAFYSFLRTHLTDDGCGLVCTMGDGAERRKSDVSTAFDLQERRHGATGRKLLLAGTSCRMVTWDEFLGEIQASGLRILEHGLTEAPPDFPVMMYAVVK